MNERILLLRKSLNLTQKEFAKKIGISHGTLSDIEKNKIPIQERHIITISLAFAVNENWLRTGEGDMFLSINPNFDNFMNIFDSLNPVLQEFLFNVANELLKAQDNLTE